MLLLSALCWEGLDWHLTTGIRGKEIPAGGQSLTRAATAVLELHSPTDRFFFGLGGSVTLPTEYHTNEARVFPKKPKFAHGRLLLQAKVNDRRLHSLVQKMVSIRLVMKT